MLYYLKSESFQIVRSKILGSIYFASFESNLNYCSLVCAQNYVINNLVILQKKKPLKTFNVKILHTSPLFRKTSILTFNDKINSENILFISKPINNLLPSLFNNCFAFS